MGDVRPGVAGAGTASARDTGGGVITGGPGGAGRAGLGVCEATGAALAVVATVATVVATGATAAACATGVAGAAVATLGAGARLAAERGMVVATTGWETGVLLDGVRRLDSAKVTEYSGSWASGSRRYPLGVRFSHQNTAPTAPSSPTIPIVIANPSSAVITAEE